MAYIDIRKGANSVAKDRQIEYLPQGWQWRSPGQDGQKARHAIRPDGQIVSLRQAQNAQRTARAASGQPKPAPVQRQGRTKRINAAVGNQTDTTRSTSGQPTGVGSLYNQNRHGRTESWVFRNFTDARGYITLNPLPNWAKYGIIKIRFTERLTGTDRVGSDTIGKRNGYATLGRFIDVEDLKEEAGDQTLIRGEVGNAWNNAEGRLSNYDMSGSRARVYVEFQEK